MLHANAQVPTLRCGPVLLATVMLQLWTGGALQGGWVCGWLSAPFFCSPGSKAGKRKKGLEPSTLAWARLYSTILGCHATAVDRLGKCLPSVRFLWAAAFRVAIFRAHCLGETSMPGSLWNVSSGAWSGISSS
ncbi:hypothetical protein CBR_g19047 [Chara braunii]|uniref:Uncharacterized protein n=1 Tax=Chara braunii TaxID=69332 RepID=A0A388KX34_CHABU|nr:hypothetical protein CBR_g19047 [Chara braunii]|eukprot:GBG74640.1 hypothetical protein CBR_g19047 [Chara braunii]